MLKAGWCQCLFPIRPELNSLQNAKGIPSREMSLHSFFPALVELQSFQLSAAGLSFARPPRQVTAASLPTPSRSCRWPAPAQASPPSWMQAPWRLRETSCLPLLLAPAPWAAEWNRNSAACSTWPPGPPWASPACARQVGGNKLSPKVSSIASEFSSFPILLPFCLG